MKISRRRGWIVCALMICLLTLGLYSENGGAKMNGHVNEDAIEFQNATVHDPSIVKEGDMYYVIGSHIDGAKSNDLINWENYTNGYTTPGNTMYGDLSENLAESFLWAGENDADSRGGYAVWAPEVIWNEQYVHEDGTEGAYMIYYSVSSTYIRSAVGYAVSKDMEGPFEYVDTVMYSGFYDHEAYDHNSDVNKHWANTNISDLIDEGVFEEPNPEWFTDDGRYNYRLFTNSIDANLFFDESGDLWMTYGSWAGGIFVLEVDPTTGKPIYPGEDGVTEDGRMIDRYFGTKIAGGFGHSIEGPYVYYDEEEEYYYLFTTYGGLSSTGGYQMRTFRSTSPAGPYEDGSGQAAVFPDSLDDGTVRNKVDSRDHEGIGNKLMGNFLMEDGNPSSGYASPGHNSVYVDPDSGKRFVVFHTRFPDSGEMHELRIHQLFMNQEGWPVAAPYRHAGDVGERVERQDVIGEYEVIDHGTDITAEIKKPKNITLEKNNKVTGDMSGKWKRMGHNRAELEIEGQTYEGVFLNQYNPNEGKYVITFTLMSSDGEALWGTYK
ncbi:glycoside hydrolase family 43 protein [Alkalicoccobacillus murimartini]|uniref:Beta-xylosidase n=1 Tax=Alkalicoccobacillus murimartini TaxID=171685 RepID=A0ABT9YIK5_9BACI|nr:glycoside hydrolase family 43 protein [Alkalicoccobacillus murimartini]MDQ0207536.1 beta-xylosidase [Alkalicoccobacillus murimartini]